MALSEVYPILRRAAVLFWFSFYIVSSAGAVSFPTAEEPIQGFGLIDPFPGIQFNQPVVLASPLGDTNSLFVVERLGKVFAITNLSRPNKTLLLDITGFTASDG